MIINSILQMLGPRFSDPKVKQLVNGTGCVLTGGQESATFHSLRKVEMRARMEWLVCNGGQVVHSGYLGEVLLQRQRG